MALYLAARRARGRAAAEGAVRCGAAGGHRGRRGRVGGVWPRLGEASAEQRASGGDEAGSWLNLPRHTDRSWGTTVPGLSFPICTQGERFWVCRVGR